MDRPFCVYPALFEVNSAQKQALAGVYGLGGHVQINYNSFLTDLDVPVAHAVVAAAGIIQMRIQMMAQICPCPHKWLHVRWILTPD